jgi:protein gp37
MSDGSAIQWTDATWNPTTGCTKVSPGCAHCYIDTTPPFRIAGRKFVNGATDLQLHEYRLDQPLHWQKPRRVFVNSLSDLFHQEMPEAFLDRVFAVMALTPAHTYQVLTKRHQRMHEYLSLPDRRERIGERIFRDTGGSLAQRSAATKNAMKVWPLPNVWLGVSVENQRFADQRIPVLLQTPAAIRFISAEPLLGPVSFRWLRAWPSSPLGAALKPNSIVTNELDGLRNLDWVIVGGESGPMARPFDVAWARAIVKQCKSARVACFVKQLGACIAWPPAEGILEGFINAELFRRGRDPRVDAPYAYQLCDRKGGDPRQWPEDLRVREFPAVRA